jgi:arylsulfatase A-like enzyme/alkylated DNA nucleotide flippase Atl1
MKRLPLLFFLSLVFYCQILAQTDKPNIVWITIEDTSPDFIGCYGNAQVKTPNIDALATEGVRFTHAYSTNVVCSPSRHTIITGVRTAADGCGNHRSQFKVPTEVKGFASYLKNAGYFTSNNAKTDYNLANMKAFIQNNWTEQGGKADFTKRKNKDQSFFSIFNFNESHQSRTVGNSTAWYEKEILGRLKKEEIIKAEGLEVPPFYIQNDNNRQNIARLYNCLRVTDNEVGRIVKMLKDNGDWDNTIVFFFSDHGQGMPRFKTNASRLGHQVPFIIRFPEKWQHLAPAKKGETLDDLVTFEDLAPTILSLIGIAKPDYMKGRIFLGAQKEITDNIFWGCRDNTDEVTDMGRTVIKGDYVYERIYYPHHPVLQQQAYWNRSPMLVQMRNDYQNKALDPLQASIFNPRVAEYLFNRKTDRWETVNLATDKQYEKILLEMRQINQSKVEKYADLGFLPENVIAQIDKTEAVGDWKIKNYQVKKYLDVAEMVGMGKGFLSKQMNLLADKDSVVRYWAVIGLRNQNAKDLNKKKLFKVFQSETSEMVKIELADLFIRLFNDKTQLQYLTDVVTKTNNAYAARQAGMRLANYTDLSENIVAQIRNMRKELGERHKEVGYSLTASLSTIVKAKVEDDSN